MNKIRAIEMLGGTVAEAAKTLGVSYQAVDKWPEELPQRIADRVLGAHVRKVHPELATDAPVTEQPTEGVVNA